MTAISVQLSEHAARMKNVHLRELFDDNHKRFQLFSCEAERLLIDWSKEKIDQSVWQELLQIAERLNFKEAFVAQLSGDVINRTEQRRVLHTALRGGSWAPEAIRQEIQQEKQRFLQFAEDVRDGQIAAADGSAFTDVVNIGIGGSDLGPAMATRALAPFCDGPKLHFISNVDGAHCDDVLRPLNPNTTLIIIASKTFTTLETLTNAETAKIWLQAILGQNANRHLAALSTNLEATSQFGIPRERVFGFWDFVGGRYSLWSSIGLPLAIAIGQERFEEFLNGAHLIDQHCASADLSQNLPVILALVGIWRRNGMKLKNHAVIPYEERLSRFPAYLQQLDMESNGKRVRLDGEPAADETGMVVFGEAGTNAQHSFFQLLHQGSEVIATDFLVGREVVGELIKNRGKVHHRHLVSNALAQSRALAFGRTYEETQHAMAAAGADDPSIEELASHKTFPGDRPSTTIVYPRLDPETLGKLITLYEHKVFFESLAWQINAFDQWGVELGKELAREITPMLTGERSTDTIDSSTRGLIDALSSGSSR